MMMKMKIVTKPTSSPGRAEKYPPPLMRFLRSNVGSRSRGRSRSSPMFVLRKKTAAIETQEPTSPKVTCMGQVRVKRSSKQQQPGKRAGAPTKRRCKWMDNNDKNGCFCRRLKGKGLKPRSLKTVWCKWVVFLRGSFPRKSKTREDSLQKDSKFGDKSESFVQENEHEHEEEEGHQAAKIFVSPASTPPKNAFLLTRCRSAPYRSSSLASRFWGEEEEEEETERAEAKTAKESGGEEIPTSGRESICGDLDQQPRMDPETEEKLSFFKEFEGPIDKIRERFVKSANIEAEEEEVEEEELVTTVRPLILTRCKSEPARIGEKLDPQLSFWKQRRLGFT